MSTATVNIMVIHPFDILTITVSLEDDTSSIRKTLRDDYGLPAAEYKVFVVSHTLFVGGHVALTLAFRGAGVYPDFAPRNGQ
jgi:hypothetical protein